jgi:hypothetical protein
MSAKDVVLEILRQRAWMVAETWRESLASEIAAKLGEGEKVKGKSKAEEAAEKLFQDWGDDWLRVVGQGERIGIRKQNDDQLPSIRRMLAGALTSFGTERAAEAVAAERGRIAGEVRGALAAGGSAGFEDGLRFALKIVEGVSK